MRGHYGNAPRVAGFVDRIRSDKLDADYAETYRAIVDQATTRSEWSAWLVGIEPLFKAWRNFREHAGETIDPLSYKVWNDQLITIRADAKKVGMRLPVGIGTVVLVGGGVVLGLAALALAMKGPS